MEKKGCFFALLAGMTWATMGGLGVVLGGLGLTPYEIAFNRLFFGFLLTAIFLCKKGKEKLKVDKKGFIYILIIGIITQGCTNIFYFSAVNISGSIVATLLICTGPLFTMIFSSFIFKEKLTKFNLISLAITMVGCLFVIVNGDIKKMNFDVAGIGFGLLSGLTYGLFPILSKKLEGKYDSEVIISYAFGVGAVVVFLFCDFDSLILEYSNTNIVAISLLLGLLPTGIAFFLFLKSMNYIPVVKASIISLVEIPTTAIIGMLYLNEVVTLSGGIGIFLVLGGIWISKFK
uniref:EamA family transporter n=1 Tax=Hirondellea gigas TaxID=1518452 RepID=A0A6A7GBU5_9CRUS